MLKLKVLSYYHCGKLKSGQTELELTEASLDQRRLWKQNWIQIKFKVVIIAVSCSPALGNEASLDQRPSVKTNTKFEYKLNLKLLSLR